LYNSYRTADDRWFFLIGVQAQRILPAVLGAIGREDLLGDARFGDAPSVSEHRGEFIALLDDAFAAQPLSYWAQRFDEHDVWWAPVQSPAEVLADPQARATGAFVRIERPAGAAIDSVESPVRYDGEARDVVPGPPEIGQHTEEVLASLGYPLEEAEETT
jgi:crotonobetainyl-CoA:carnitine CoA-transferase CaiB-like acyl-CoA transferase